MGTFRTLDDFDLHGKTVLVRVDFNVPMQGGRVSDATRIERSLPTIRHLLDGGARVVLLSHLGRPKGRRVLELSLEPVTAALAERLPGHDVVFLSDCIGPEVEADLAKLAPGQVALLENLRFHAGEEANDGEFAAAVARLGDLYVDDAFSAAHRAHGSVEALAHLLPAAAGRLMQTELESLSAALEQPAHPVAAIIGGAKVSTKLDLLGNLLGKVDLLIIGGGMANTFLHAQGIDVGASLCEHDLAETARALLDQAQASGCDVALPSDAVVAADLAADVAAATVPVTDVPADGKILDIGPDSVRDICARLDDCRTLIWNGPLGCFEVPPFDAGTNAVARKAGTLTRDGRIFSVAGGGDTLAALGHAGVGADFSYLSTAGGAFLEWLEGRVLPGVKALEDAAAR